MKNKTTIIVCVLCALVFGAGGFYGGMKYQQSKTPQRGSFMAQGDGQRQGAGNTGSGSRGVNGAAGAGMASGEIIAKDDKSLTVKLPNGSSKIILYAASTQWQKMADATLDDFAVGQQVVASGTANADGSLTAKSVQLRANVTPITK